MESALVIKVKFGDTLRRFSAGVNEEGLLDLDMVGLRTKILSLFSFPSDADFTLTYIDEDGDVVTLVDDDDLRDALRQRPKFLRLDVHLNNHNFDKSNTWSSASSTPTRSPQVQNPLPYINAGVTETLKSIPEPLREILQKSLDLVSTAASVPSNPLLTELVDCFTKMGQANLNTSQHTQGGAYSSTQTVSSQIPTTSSVPGDGGSRQVSSRTKSNVASNTNKGLNNENLTRSVIDTVDLNVDPPTNSNPAGCVNMDDAPAATYIPGGEDWNKIRKQSSDNLSGRTSGFGASACLGDASSCIGAPANSNSGFCSRPWVGGLTECPFTGVPLVNEVSTPLHPPHGVPFRSNKDAPFIQKRPVKNENLHPIRQPQLRNSSIHNGPMVGMFHRGVQCDGCGVHPIAGARYKSKVKEDYDLCGICFAVIGNDADYIKMDRPMPYRFPRILKRPQDLRYWPTPKSVFGSYGMNSAASPKLDSCFVLDVNVLDGTMMAPSTPFTKIWRMRNNGTVAWPRGARLMWVGGDRFSHVDSIAMQIPADGVPVGGELDIAVDFTAPELPGRYISYWRMASPSSVKFGQQVWVLVLVDGSLGNSVCDSSQGLNLNLPADCNSSRSPENLDMNAHPVMDGGSLEPCNSNSVSELVKPMVDEQPLKDPELNFPINDALLVGHGISAAVEQPQGPSSVSYPIIDFSETGAPSDAAPAGFSQPFPAMDAPASSEGISTNNAALEKILLKKLEDMGFKQVDLNKEILRMNGYNLELSVDELCDVVEWDPILEELRQMGFCDEEMNRKLLKKHNGSIKRVVMDILAAGEKA